MAQLVQALVDEEGGGTERVRVMSFERNVDEDNWRKKLTMNPFTITGEKN